MNTKPKIISTIVAVVLLVGAFFFIKKHHAQPADVGLVFDTSATSSSVEDSSAPQDAAVPQEPPMGGYKWYANADYGFAFQYPQDMSATIFGAEKNGNMVLVQGKENKGFQIYITNFDEDMPVITAARVHKDLPNLPIEQPQEAVLGGGLHALIFWSKDAAIGRTREVWIVHDRTLYQFTAPAEFDTELAKILGTWKFE